MSFVGPVNRIGDASSARTTSTSCTCRADGAEEAMIDRIVHLGFEVRVELTLPDGEPLGRS